MKKITLLLLIMSFSAVFMFAGERFSQQTSIISQNDGIHFSLPSDRSSVRLFSDDISTEESIGGSNSYSPKRSKKEIKGLVAGGVGAGLFGLNWFTYLIAGLVAPFAACGSAAILAKRPLCIGVMATSWIPIIGPFAGGTMTLMMTENSLYSSSAADVALYTGVGVYCIMTGFLEIGFLAMMISGFAYAGYQRRKSKMAKILDSKVLPIVGTVVTQQDRKANMIGVRVRI